MPKPNDDRALERIFEALADSELQLSDAEVFDAVKAEGLDPKNEADRLRSLVREASKRVRLRKLNAAHLEHQRRVRTINQSKFSLPSTAAEKRALLIAILQQRPEMTSGITAQHRDFSKLSDEDVDTALRQLAALGVLKDQAADE